MIKGWGRLVELDNLISARLRVAEKPGILRSVFAILAHSGDSWFWLIGLGVLWLWGSEYWKERVKVLIIGIVALACLVILIKFMVRRKRPEGEWGMIYRNTDPHSFPSGHAARAFLLAVLSIYLGPAWFGWVVLIWAPLVSLARIAMGLHYVSDVAAGMFLGIGLGVGFTYFQIY
jgi:undecaprenyl-diphosphatase